MSHVDANLVSAAGVEPAAHEARHGGPSKHLDELIAGDRLPPGCPPGDVDFLAIGAAAAEGRRDDTAAAHGHAPDERQVLPLEPAVTAMGSKLLGEPAMGAIIFCDHHETARIFVEAVNDAWPLYAANSREAAAAVGNEGIDQGAARVSGTGVDDKAGLFVDDDEVSIFIDDIQRDGLGPRHGRNSWRQQRLDLLAGPDPVPRFADCRALDGNPTFGNSILKARTAHIRKVPAQETVETVAVMFGGD